MLGDYLNIFQGTENKVTVILNCVLYPSICKDPSVLLLSGHTSGKGFEGLTRDKSTIGLVS